MEYKDQIQSQQVAVLYITLNVVQMVKYPSGRFIREGEKERHQFKCYRLCTLANHTHNTSSQCNPTVHVFQWCCVHQSLKSPLGINQAMREKKGKQVGRWKGAAGHPKQAFLSSF